MAAGYTHRCSSQAGPRDQTMIGCAPGTGPRRLTAPSPELNILRRGTCPGDSPIITAGAELCSASPKNPTLNPASWGARARVVPRAREARLPLHDGKKPRKKERFHAVTPRCPPAHHYGVRVCHGLLGCNEGGWLRQLPYDRAKDECGWYSSPPRAGGCCRCDIRAWRGSNPSQGCPPPAA